MENVLVLDPATSSGYCLLSIDKENDVANIYEEGYIDVNTKSDYQGDHCLDLMNKLSSIIDRESCSKIVIEDFFFSYKFRNGSNVNSAFRTAIHILARQKDIPYLIININAWKTYIAGRSTPTREQKKKWGKIANKMFIQQALWEKYKFKFPNHSISEKGRVIKFRTDIVDVVAQAIYFVRMILDIRNVTRSVQISEDCKLPKSIKCTYKYE